MVKTRFILLLILFVSLFAFMQIVPQAKADTLYEYYDTGDDKADQLGWNVWAAQTFTPSNSYYISKVSLKIFKQLTPETATVSIRATSGGKPTGSDLTNGTLVEGSINATSPGSWHNITVTTYLLQAETQYAIVLRSSDNWVFWRLDDSSATYSGGTELLSADSGATWITYVHADLMFRTYGGGYGFTFKGVFNEDTGLLKSASQRATNVTAHFSDGTVDETFEVNGTYSYTTTKELLYFSFNITGSTSTADYIVSQYGLNLYVYNGSEYYYILFATVEPDTDYELNVTATWSTTTTIATKTTTGANVTFGTPPINLTSTYLNYYLYRTSTSTTQTERTREYWISPLETYGGTIYIFDGDFTSYEINFLDLGGVLEDYPFIGCKRYVNGTLMLVEKRKVDENNMISMELIRGEKYTLTIEGATTAYTYGDLLMGSVSSITLTLRGIDFPKETLLTYKYVRIYGLRSFGGSASIAITYEDLLNQTVSVVININYANGTNAYTTTETTNSFVVSWFGVNSTFDYQVIATIHHERYGTYEWRQYYPRSYSSNPWVLGWLGALEINVNYLIGIFIVIVVGASFSMLNPAIGAFLATCVAAALTVMGWLPLLPGTLLAAFCFSIMFGLVWAKRRVASY